MGSTVSWPQAPGTDKIPDGRIGRSRSVIPPRGSCGERRAPPAVPRRPERSNRRRPFDPHVHHAVEKKPVKNAPDETVIDEHQRGYNFKGRLLRPAMVSVAVAPVSSK
ncbi:MAG TPA: nucleotide exchange factor GrpE [Candidatus Sulfotelmatobacter sp.]